MTTTAPLSDEQIAMLIGGRAEVRSEGQTWYSTIESLSIEYVGAQKLWWLSLVVAATPAIDETPAHDEWVYDDYVFGDGYSFLQELEGDAFYLQVPALGQSIVMWPVGYKKPVELARKELESARLMKVAVGPKGR